MPAVLPVWLRVRRVVVLLEYAGDQASLEYDGYRKTFLLFNVVCNCECILLCYRFIHEKDIEKAEHIYRKTKKKMKVGSSLK